MSVVFILMPPNKFKDQTNGVIATTQHEKKKIHDYQNRVCQVEKGSFYIIIIIS